MMSRIWFVILLVVVGLATAPVFAGELRVTGFFDNVIQTEGNISNVDNDVTNNKDQATFASERTVLFFNFIASDDLRGVLGLELDAIWGAPARNRLGGDALVQEGRGFRNAIDINNFELKQLYADFRIPQLPIGNRWRLGGIRPNPTPLHPNMLLNVDVGGAEGRLDFSSEVSLMFYYIQLEEDVERFPGSVKIGEDYLTGATLMLKPLPGWDLHFPFLYQHLQGPFGDALNGGLGTPFSGSATPNETTNVVAEDRYYLGFDTRYRLGNLRIEPTFLYLFGTRKFCTAGQVTGHSTSGAVDDDVSGVTQEPTFPCTSPAAGGVREIDWNAFAGQLEVNYTLGKWLWSGMFTYASGSDADADLNNQGLTRGRTSEDIETFRTAGTEAPRFQQWLDILGRGDLSGRTLVTPYRLGEGSAPGLNRFGRVVGAGKVEYKLTDKLTLRGVLGAVWTAETPKCPAVDRTGTITATNPLGCTPLTRNFTGDSKYLGTEVNVYALYTIMPGLLNIFGGAWAFLGDGLEINDRRVQDGWVLLNRIGYLF